MNNKQRQDIIDYLEQGDRFSEMLIRELDRGDISDSEKRTYSSLLDAILSRTEIYCYMSEWPDNVEVFMPKRKRNVKEDNEVDIKIQHGPVTMEIVKKISECVHELPLNQEQNDQLVHMMLDQLLMAEHEQYIAGFCECMKTVRNGGFKGLEDKLEAMVTHKKEGKE